ncbi:MAG TPA: GGDEF domain-containing protein [Pyrinomonadaceae bacterium]|nr:GGDEF domain-containing protein [Pyrinomonadaceae bacterium]
MSLAEAIDQLGELAAEIRREAFTDDKTSLKSALALHQEERLSNAGGREPYIVIFGDLNDFKHINDDYSHDAGDVALRAVGETIRRIVIDDLGGKAFRRSGDEFVILLNQDSLSGFLSTVSSFREIPFSHNNRELSTGMSLGYAIGDGKASFEELTQRADAACQLAKRPGEDSCIIWTEDIEINPLVRISGWCPRCSAKISCTLPKNKALMRPTSCPCCGESLQDV